MAQKIDIQGHRGARGLRPENGLHAIGAGVTAGADSIEIDVVSTSDDVVILNHEPWMNPVIASHPDNWPVKTEQAKGLNLHKMTFAYTQRYDFGLRGNPDFPEAWKMASVRIKLSHAFRAADQMSETRKRGPVDFNIEIKSKPEWEPEYQLAPEPWAKLVYDVVVEADMLHRTTISSFDPRILEALHPINEAAETKIKLSFLVETEDSEKGLDENLSRLSFVPEIYSPHYSVVTEDLVKAVHDKGMRITVWTVNEPEDMLRLAGYGIDGLISDYPDRAVETLRPPH